MNCPYLDQNLGKTILTGFLGGTYSGAWKCKAQNGNKITDQFEDQVCRKNDAYNCMNCNWHPVQR